MKEDPKLEADDAWSEGRAYSPKRRGSESGSSRYLRILLVLFLVLVVAGGILYFLGRRPTGSDAGPLQSKVIVLEQRITGLEKQIAELHGKITSSGQDPALLQRLDALWQKVEALEKESTAEPKAKSPTPPKPIASSQKKYHTVQKGETLYGISKKYGIKAEELRKLNNLSKDALLRTGQKLLISPER